MGKVDDLRRLREQRYAAKPAAPAAKAAAGRKALTAALTLVEPSGELCGHRSIGNKSCTREADHVATGTKSHRYR